jgi:hypothetical protein
LRWRCWLDSKQTDEYNILKVLCASGEHRKLVGEAWITSHLEIIALALLARRIANE